MFKILIKYLPDLLLLFLSIIGLIFWLLMGIPFVNTFYLLIFLIIFTIIDLFIYIKEPKIDFRNESEKLINLNMNESLNYSLILLSLGFSSVIGGLSIFGIKDDISIVLIFIGGFFVLLGSVIERFIYYPRAEYLKKIWSNE